jgi:hypothetical protein
MAKSPASNTSAALKAALPPDVKVIEVPAGARVQVDVDVNEMVIPYTISIDGHVLIKSLVDRREDIPDMTPGTHRLAWGFMHNVKDWSHTITLRINDTAQQLEKRSEAEKHSDHSIGVAFLIVS